MIAKYGFALVVAAFGALMFGAGLVAPDSVRRLVGTDAGAIAAQPVPAAGAPAKPAPAPTPAAPAPAAEAPVLIEQLMVPVPPPEKRQYALQVGRFASADLAASLGARVRQQGLPFDKVLKAVDQAGTIWFIVAAGPYRSMEEARAARLTVSLDLGADGALPVILLPAPAPKT